jgi:hypothetical protein
VSVEFDEPVSPAAIFCIGLNVAKGADRKRRRLSHVLDPYAGLELLDGAFMWLDLTPNGRNEIGGVMSWVRLHDENEKKAGPASCNDRPTSGEGLPPSRRSRCELPAANLARLSGSL